MSNASLYEDAQRLAKYLCEEAGYQAPCHKLFTHHSQNFRARDHFATACNLMYERDGHEMYDVICEYEENHFDESHVEAINYNNHFFRYRHMVKNKDKAWDLAINVNRKVNIAREAIRDCN